MTIAGFFSFFTTNFLGILVFLLCISSVFLFTHWIAYVFALGRYRTNKDQAGPGYVIIKLFDKVINDFRHLLAFTIITIFAGSLLYSLISTRLDATKISDALQAVVSTLGGIVGSIIGYYFGEAKGKSETSTEGEKLIESGPEEVQQESEQEKIEKVQLKFRESKGDKSESEIEQKPEDQLNAESIDQHKNEKNGDSETEADEITQGTEPKDDVTSQEDINGVSDTKVVNEKYREKGTKDDDSKT